jgi:hypothetical protein
MKTINELCDVVRETALTSLLTSFFAFSAFFRG